jgi:hypothetical protein
LAQETPNKYQRLNSWVQITPQPNAVGSRHGGGRE